MQKALTDVTGRPRVVRGRSLVPAARPLPPLGMQKRNTTRQMDEYAVAHLVEIDEINDGRCPFRPIRHNFGITSFGVNAWTGPEAGDRIINEHDEAGEDEELYVVQSGRATFELDGERVDAPAGTFVFARPGVKRTAYAEEPETTILAVGGAPGQAYEPDGWEIWAPFNRLYLEGRYAEAADAAREAAKAHPEYAGLLYNLACCESLAGRTADAIEHLRLAIGKSERFRSFAVEDSDFRAIREKPAFQALVAG
jgi:quercetin dioxygenase-like cupin family protein